MKIYENFPEIRFHLKTLQVIIDRMACNSLFCKLFYMSFFLCFPRSSYALVFSTLLFLILDTCFLSLEKRFRNTYNLFVKSLHNNDLVSTDFFTIKPTGNSFNYFFKSLKSFSILPFYSILFLIGVPAVA